MSLPVARLRAGTTPDMARKQAAFDDPAVEAQRLTVALTPAATAEAMEVLQYLFRILPMENSGETEAEKEENATAMLAGYATATSGFPRWAIVEVRGDFLAGRVEGQSLKFAPKPPELGHELARRVSDYRAKLSRVSRQAEERVALVAAPHQPLSNEARERGRRRIEELRAIGAEETRRVSGRAPTSGYVDPNPITEESLDAAGVPRAPARGTGTMEKLSAPGFDPMSRRARR